MKEKGHSEFTFGFDAEVQRGDLIAQDEAPHETHNDFQVLVRYVLRRDVFLRKRSVLAHRFSSRDVSEPTHHV